MGQEDLVVGYVVAVFSFMMDVYAGSTRRSDLCARVDKKMVKIIYSSCV